MSYRNQTVNSTDEINKIEKVDQNYNVRDERPKVVTGEKRERYDLLEEKRGLYENELSCNYWVIK